MCVRQKNLVLVRWDDHKPTKMIGEQCAVRFLAMETEKNPSFKQFDCLLPVMSNEE